VPNWARTRARTGELCGGGLVAEDGYRLIVMGASAGGVEALRSVVAGFPPSLPAAVLVVLHLPADAPSALPAILSRAGRCRPSAPRTGRGRFPAASMSPRQTGTCCCWAGGCGCLHGRSRTDTGRRSTRCGSAARSCGSRVIGVVLSGARDDGAAGLCAIVRRGGTAVVQDPGDGLHPSMPQAALEQVETATVAPAAQLGPVLARLAAAPLPDKAAETADRGPGHQLPDDLVPDPVLDAEVAMTDLEPVTADEMPIAPAGYGRPSCGGALFEIEDGPVPRYRCRVGHAWSPESLLAEHGVALERALWIALRALEEKSALSRRLASAGAARGSTRIAERYLWLGREADGAAGTLRRLIVALGTGPGQAE
jgi:two-component system, chemotaxis family, protein-glutamate methylesterase/glutaminase